MSKACIDGLCRLSSGVEEISPLAVPQDTETLYYLQSNSNPPHRERDSGGIIIWTNSELSIELVKSEQYHVAENKKRHYINISARLSVCHIYIPPLESPYFQEETFQT